MEQLAPNVWIHRVKAEGFETVCAVVLTWSRAFVIDTLLKPEDMDPVKELLKERAGGLRTVVINTHHHWDHVYGNGAFTGVDIVAQRGCPRLIEAQNTTASESVPLPPRDGVPLPNITFGDRLTYADEDETVHLLHTPGHTEDSIVVFLANAHILFGGDTVEWPLPNFAQRDGTAAWVRTLRGLKQLSVETVVPGHGPVMGKTIIDANEHYVAGLQEAVAQAKREGVGRSKLDLALEGFVPEGAEVDEFHATAHRENLQWMWDEV